MNKRITKILSVSSILLSSLFTLASCGGIKKGEVIFNNTAYVDLNDIPAHINIKIDLPNSKIDYINIGTRIRIKSGQATYKDGILSIDTKALYSDEGVLQLNSGDRVAKIKCQNVNKLEEVNILFVDKIIKTAEDLQKINENPSGSYILGNDIDCSSIGNFEPLGYATTSTSTTVNKEFLGVFDGNGYAIKNLTSRYSMNMGSEESSRKSGTYLFDNESHKMGNMFGVFQHIGPSGIVRNTAFKNVKVYGRTISGVIAGQNSGLIENCFIDEDCSATISTHFYDESCNVGAICGLNDADGANQCVRNVISLAKCYIEGTFTGYGEEYIEGNTSRLRETFRKEYGGDVVVDEETGEEVYDPEFEAAFQEYLASFSSDELMRWTFYGGTKGDNKKDSNGVETNGVYAGVGISYGAVMNSYCLNFNIETYGAGNDLMFSGKANFGQTHVFDNKNGDGPDAGVLQNCLMKSMEELKDASIYDTFSKSAWNIYDGEIPSLRAFYSYYTY
ncbi:MAG: hypothetical protein J1F32_07035 [Erysipelotrichales bacterium]|nr:hypothetical protein [Erysipelotrichales bacterium]